MLTRCPACQTIFRLRPEQLRARHGEVRCGHCFNPFNALEHLLEGDASAQASAAATSSAPPTPAEAEEPVAARPEPTPQPDLPPVAALPEPFEAIPADAGEPTARPRFSDLEFDIPDSVPTVPLQLDEDELPSTALPDKPPRTFETLADRLEPSIALQATEAQTAPPAAHTEPDTPTIDAASIDELTATGPRVDFSAMVAAAGTRLANAQNDADTALSDPAADAPAVIQRLRLGEAQADPADSTPLHANATAPVAEPYEATSGQTAPIVAAETDIAHLDANYGPPPARSDAHSGLLGAGVALLLIGLLLQSAYVFRDAIARELPGLRPLYVAACASLGCDMPLPREAALINIESPDLQSEPGRPGRYILHATIQNRANFPQAWPHLELTLTDAGDVPVVRRVLTPEEWVPANRLRGDFRARSDATVRLPFGASEVAPTGYRVYVFYP